MKRIAVFTDTHGNISPMMNAINSKGPFDLIIHLGDGVIDGKKIAEESGIDFIGILGNEDIVHSFPEKYLLTINNFTFLFTHGIQFEINAYMNETAWKEKYRIMTVEALMEGADALFFGHTHKALLIKKNNIIMCNPGDQYIGSALRPSFAMVDIFDDKFIINIARLSVNEVWEIESNLSSISK